MSGSDADFMDAIITFFYSVACGVKNNHFLSDEYFYIKNIPFFTDDIVPLNYVDAKRCFKPFSVKDFINLCEK